ncbi:MAG: GH92 family glycosyl hydrolase [Spirochaetales bacterium]|nr:GH92 family glycosyl hydrolase [Spirochaetales bacterium]
MKKITLILSFLLITVAAYCDKKDPIDYVNPNIGTAHSRWFFYTPASLPFGMAKLAPTTDGHYANKNGWEASGYDPRHISIEGFANVHEFQLGGVKIMPTSGTIISYPGKEGSCIGYRSEFDKKEEFASPGYYKVRLKRYNITAELTATKRVGFHRYTFPASKNSNIIFDIGRKLGESGNVIDSYVEFDGKETIQGYVTYDSVYVRMYKPEEGDPITIFFYIKLDKEPTSYGSFKNLIKGKGKKVARGKQAGLFLTFNTQESEQINLKVGISYTSIENAQLNYKEEAENRTFDEVHAEAVKTWNDELSKIKVEGSIESDKIKFYTGLYHVLLGRGLASDINGSYPKQNGEFGQIPLAENGKPRFNFYNSDAIWGGFWNITQLWALVWPEYYRDYVLTHLQVYKDTGWLSDGIVNSRYVSGVGTNFVGLVAGAAYQLGILKDENDIKIAYEATIKDNLEFRDRPRGAGKEDLKPFIEKGYIPYSEKIYDRKEVAHFSCSRALEYSFSSYAAAQFAKALGKEADYKILARLADNWKNIYNEENNFIQARDINGNFIKNFNPYEAWRGYQEGNAWQYTFYVPHDPTTLVEKMGKNEFNNRLNKIFEESSKKLFGGGSNVNAFAGIETVYNHGNQPCLAMPYLFNYSGKPWLTQKWVREIMNVFYGTDEIHGYGFGQDEDQGQLGGWFCLSALGLFDIKGLSETDPSFQFGSPLFDKVEIKLPNGKFLQIIAHNNSKLNYYHKIVLFNRKKAERSLSYKEIMQGGILEFFMEGNAN